MEERRREKENLENRKKDIFQKLSETRKKLAEANNGSTDLSELKKAIAQLEKEEKEILKKEDELKKKEKQTPWNVDTISEPGFTKTVINTKAPRPREENLTEEQKEEKMKKFIKENEKLLKQFGMLRRYDDSQRFLQQHSHLVCEETANYLVIWCINLEMEGVCFLADWKREVLVHLVRKYFSPFHCSNNCCFSAFKQVGTAMVSNENKKPQVFIWGITAKLTCIQSYYLCASVIRHGLCSRLYVLPSCLSPTCKEGFI